MKHRARCSWLALGDSNTTYFGNSVKERKSKNWIHQIKDSEGNVRKTDEEIEEEAIRFCINLLQNQSTNPVNVEEMGKKLTQDEGDMLEEDFSDEEIKDMIFNEKEDKAPGVDGYNVYFYKKLRGEIEEILGFKVEKLPVRYLGLPLSISKLSEKGSEPLVEIIHKKISNCKNKFLSYGGRLELIRSVLQTYSVYWAGCFDFSKGVLERIEQMLTRFLWSGNDEQKCVSAVSWDDLCMPKKEGGGLGIKKLKDFNNSLLMRTLWGVVELDIVRLSEQQTLQYNHEFAIEFDRIKATDEEREDQYVKIELQLAEANKTVKDLTQKIESKDAEAVTVLGELASTQSE
ncbi:hypothetical protein GIB67_028614 [Kingdonia uniflora]|uniref:Uncharacterized protein n=1 Tax=Kingdonia uniflora TaxID=39325 RepID=A0A7J7KZJ7_9MAGN|nr:hypothetical protein GIB67_028614 [Kingdonia uniflora]